MLREIAIAVLKLLSCIPSSHGVYPAKAGAAPRKLGLFHACGSSLSCARVFELIRTVQVRLAYAGPTGMQISWNAFSKLTSPPIVRYGFSPHFLPFVSSPANAESVTYPTSLTYGNHVRLTHLFPNTQYYYQPVHANKSQTYSFKTAREKSNHAPYRTPSYIVRTSSYLLHFHAPFSPFASSLLMKCIPPAGDITYTNHWLKEEIRGFLLNTTISDGVHVYESLLISFTMK